MKKEEQGQSLNLQETTKPRFKIIYETFYANKDLTLDEIGLMTKLISLAPSFKINSIGLASLLKINIKRLTKASKGLQEKGYLIIINNGKNGATWTINQEPIKPNVNIEEMIENISDYSLRDLENLYKSRAINKNEFLKLREEMRKMALTPIYIDDEE